MRNKQDHDRILKELAMLVIQALPLARQVASNEFTSEERKHLRSLTGIQGGYSNAVFELNNLLSNLCGETARRLFSGDPKLVAKAKRRLQRLVPKIATSGNINDVQNGDQL